MNRARLHELFDEFLDVLASDPETAPKPAKRKVERRRQTPMPKPPPSGFVPNELDRARARRLIARQG